MYISKLLFKSFNTKIMKSKNFYTGLALILGCVSFSCTKLDQKVYSVVPDANFWKTPDQIAAGIAPAYQALTNIPDGNVMQLNEVSSDEMIVPTRGNDWYDNGNWQALWQHTWKPDLGPIDGTWSDIYNGVGKANFTLSVVNSLENKPDNIDAINAELKVLRAYYYYLAMDMFGNVPLVTDFNTDPSTVTNSTRKDVFNFIESELKTNVPLLTDANDASTYGRMNKWAGFMLMAKLYLNAQVYTGTQRWADAIAACDSVINSGKYSLQASYFDNFAVNNQGSSENIFVVPYDKVNIGGNNWEMQTLHYQLNLKYNLTGSPWNGFCATADYYFGNFSAGDRRTSMWLIGQQYDISGNPIVDAQTGQPLVISPWVNQLSNPADSFRRAGVRNVKYFPEAGTAGNQSNDMVIFRLADAYLMKAEAEVRAANVTDGLDLVNMVRERAYGDASHDWTMPDLTLDNILSERARELAWEGWRRQDLIRYEVASGKKYFSAARNPGKVADADSHTQIFPIPSPEISSNPNLSQNPGY